MKFKVKKNIQREWITRTTVARKEKCRHVQEPADDSKRRRTKKGEIFVVQNRMAKHSLQQSTSCRNLRGEGCASDSAWNTDTPEIREGKASIPISSPAGRLAQSFRLHGEMERRGRRAFAFKNQTGPHKRQKEKNGPFNNATARNSETEPSALKWPNSKTKWFPKSGQNVKCDLPRRNREIKIAQQRGTREKLPPESPRDNRPAFPRKWQGDKRKSPLTEPIEGVQGGGGTRTCAWRMKKKIGEGNGEAPLPRLRCCGLFSLATAQSNRWPKKSATGTKHKDQG